MFESRRIHISLLKWLPTLVIHKVNQGSYKAQQTRRKYGVNQSESFFKSGNKVFQYTKFIFQLREVGGFGCININKNKNPE